MTLETLFSNKPDAEFMYQMLDRLRTDCDYFLNCGNHNTDRLWAKSVKEHIAVMRLLYCSVPDTPDWLTLADIDEYEFNMLYGLGKEYKDDKENIHGNINYIKTIDFYVNDNPERKRKKALLGVFTSIGTVFTIVNPSNLPNGFSVDIAVDIDTEVYQITPFGKQELIMDEISIMKDRTVSYRARILKPKDGEKDIYVYLKPEDFNKKWFVSEETERINIKEFIAFLKEHKIKYQKAGDEICVGDIIYQFDEYGEMFSKVLPYKPNNKRK